MKHPKTDYLRETWTEYVQGLNGMRWNIAPNTPEHKKFLRAFSALFQLAQSIKATSEVEEGDTVTNGKETFKVLKVEEDRVYCSESDFYHSNTLRIKDKFIEPIPEHNSPVS